MLSELRSIHEKYMREALKKAEYAFLLGEVPVGAVIVKDSEIIAASFNTVERDKLASSHAELRCIEEASRKLNSWRLDGCILYVTLEPCPMCMGAVINSHMREVVFGAFDERLGACGSIVDLSDGTTSMRVRSIGGVLENECADMLKCFFALRRE